MGDLFKVMFITKKNMKFNIGFKLINLKSLIKFKNLKHGFF